jgi:hypothetical protein
MRYDAGQVVVGHFRFAELFLRVQLNKPVVRRKLGKVSSSSKSSLMGMLTGTYASLQIQLGYTEEEERY